MISKVTAFPHCPNCGTVVTGAYCPNCGQKKFDPKELTLGHFVKESTEHITHFDSKIFTAIQSLFAKPGYLTREFCLGRFKKHIKPLTLFLLLNAFFFFLGHQLLSIKDADYTYYTTQYPAAKKFFDQYVVSHHTTDEEVGRRFNHTKEVFQKLSYFFIIPIFAVGLMIIFVGHKRMFIEHLVHAIHTFCWYIITIVIFIPIFALVFEQLHFRHENFEFILAIILTSICFVYNLLSVKRIYSFQFLKSFLYAIPITALMIYLDTSFYGSMNYFFTWLTFKF